MYPRFWKPILQMREEGRFPRWLLHRVFPHLAMLVAVDTYWISKYPQRGGGGLAKWKTLHLFCPHQFLPQTSHHQPCLQTSWRHMVHSVPWKPHTTNTFILAMGNGRKITQRANAISTAACTIHPRVETGSFVLGCFKPSNWYTFKNGHLQWYGGFKMKTAPPHNLFF